MTDTLTDTAAVTRLVVLSGLHAGARCELPSGECSIGSAAADAVILGDAGIEPGHVILDLQEASATIRPLHGNVALDGVDLPPDESRSAPLPFELTLSGVVLRCDAEHRDADQAHARAPSVASLLPMLKSAWRLPALACAAVALFIIAPAMGSITPDAGKARELVPGPTPAASASLAASKLPVVPAPASPMPIDTLHELQAELSARSLSDIQLTANDGMIMARGRVDPRNESEWRLVQQWFDGRHGRRATLVDEVRFAASPAPKLAVDAVWTGRNPNVVIKGQKYFEGATLPNGFRLERVAPGELLVAREGQRQALKF